MLMDDIEVKVYRSRIKLPVIFFVPATFLLTVYVLLYMLVNSQVFVTHTVGELTGSLPGAFNVRELDPTLRKHEPAGVSTGNRLQIEQSRDRLARDPGFIAHEHRSLDYVSQLSDVAGPVVVAEFADRFLGEFHVPLV